MSDDVRRMESVNQRIKGENQGGQFLVEKIFCKQLDHMAYRHQNRKR